MTTSIADVRKGLADALKAIPELETRAYLPAQVTPPMAAVARRAMDPRMVFTGGTNAYSFAVIVYTQATESVDGEMAMDRYCETSGTFSVKAAVETEANWPDDLVAYAQVTEIGETQLSEVAGAAYLTTEFTIEVVW